ncbi:MAG TPA: heme-binding protein [Streptosporangiaceae bacterium]|jgi:hypothetical protein
MELAPDFSFQPLPPIGDQAELAPRAAANPLGPLAGLLGSWSGHGFNVIWRPDHSAGQDHFLELNVTSDQIDFATIPGAIPNRGLLQPDINMFGLTYLQQVKDTNLNAGLHIEPGLWVAIPATSNPKVGPTVARLASIPHGTTIVAQGTATTAAGPPAIPPVGIKPFTIGHPGQTVDFPEQTLSTASAFRTAGAGLAGVTQPMVNDPNNVLTAAIKGQTITSTTTLHIATNDTPVPGGGTANTAFLQGIGQSNADAALVTATFWLETLQGQTSPSQLQYSQTVFLRFNGLSWPHITVGTLRKAAGS